MLHCRVRGFLVLRSAGDEGQDTAGDTEQAQTKAKIENGMSSRTSLKISTSCSIFILLHFFSAEIKSAKVETLKS